MKQNTLNTDTVTEMKQSKIKCVVWDLDNTLWHGVLTENDKLTLRENIRAIMQTLDERGILQSVASRNTHEDAMAKLKDFGLDEFFLYPQINWGSKSDSLRIIKEKTNIGYDTIAFIDDQAFEREEVAFVHPEVQCFSEKQIDQLLDMDVFNPRFITDESARRRRMYQLDAKRNEIEASFSNNLEFLKSLDMKFTISRANKTDLQRVEELTVRTNQLNATGYTYSYEELEQMLEDDRLLILVAALEDKYGSYGKIGVALIDCNDPEIWEIKLLLMSCRVMSRGVGSVLLNFLINYSRKEQKQLRAHFLPTDRNRMMYITYKFAGFREIATLENGGQLLSYRTEDQVSYPDYVDLQIDLLHP
ncbi:MAG: HAD-IIIC family phosphatase [Bacteroidota bacterium]